MAAEIGPVAQVGVQSMAALRYPGADGYDVVVPVRPARAVHASFRHIEVLPDIRVQDGIPLYKLQILDALLEYYSAPARRDFPSEQAPAADGTREATANILVNGLSRGTRSPAPGSYRAGLLPLPGALVDLVA